MLEFCIVKLRNGFFVFIEAIRSRLEYAHTIVAQIAYTLETVSHTDRPGERNRRHAEGAFDFVTKPVDYEDLEATIEKTLTVLEQMRETNQRLRESERMLRAAIDLHRRIDSFDLIRDASQENQVSLLLVTHSPDVASRFGRVEKLSDFNRPSV